MSNPNDRVITWKPYPDELPKQGMYLVDYGGHIRIMEYLGGTYDTWKLPHNPEPLREKAKRDIRAFAELPEPL